MSTYQKLRDWTAKFGKITDVLEDFSEVADVVSRIDGRPKSKDWLAIALKSGYLLSRVHERIEEALEDADRRSYEGWASAPGLQMGLDIMYAAGHLHRDKEQDRFLTGKGIKVRRYRDDHTTPWRARVQDHEALLSEAESCLWMQSRLKSVKGDDISIDESCALRPIGEALVERIQKYYAKDVTRVLMMIGLPGTGKSRACRTIVAKLGLPTVLCTAEPSNMERLVDFGVLGAKVCIIEDFDWGKYADIPRLFSILEKLRAKYRVVLLTANRVSDLPGPVLRPGRVDEIVEWTGCTKEEIEALGAPEACVGWPIAHVQEVLTRLSVEDEVDLEEIRSRIGEESSCED